MPFLARFLERNAALGQLAQPLGRNGEHSELANLAAFLLSDQAGYITGECIVIDGGKQLMSDAGSRTVELLGWSDADWERMRQQASRKS